MSLKEIYKKLLEESLKSYHKKQIRDYKLYYLKGGKSGGQAIYARKKGSKLRYVTADPDKVEERIKEISEEND